MDEDELEELEPLWTTEKHEYVLWASVEIEEPTLSDYLIIHKNPNRALIIEDDALADEVKGRMLEAGVPVVRALPESSVKPVLRRLSLEELEDLIQGRLRISDTSDCLVDEPPSE